MAVAKGQFVRVTVAIISNMMSQQIDLAMKYLFEPLIQPLKCLGEGKVFCFGHCQTIRFVGPNLTYITHTFLLCFGIRLLIFGYIDVTMSDEEKEMFGKNLYRCIEDLHKVCDNF